MSSTLLAAIMQLKGIDDSFVNAAGLPATVSDENIKRIIQAMGVDANSDESLASHYQAEETKHWLSLLPPVAVFQHASAYELEVRLPIDFVTDNLLYRITTENGELIELQLTATDFPLLAVNEISDVEFQMYALTLSTMLPQGYHHLALLEEGNEEPLAVMALIITPEHCYQPVEFASSSSTVTAMAINTQLKQDNKVHYLDVNTIKLRIQEAALEGVKVLHLTPGETLLPECWQPIAELDLRAINEDVVALPTITAKTVGNEFALFIDKLAQLRDIFSTFSASMETSTSTTSFSDFLLDGGETLTKKASFAAVQFHCLDPKASMKVTGEWPEGFQSYESEKTQIWLAAHQQEVRFWSFCYWLTTQQTLLLEAYATLQGIRLGCHQYGVIGAVKQSVTSWGDAKYYGSNVHIGQSEQAASDLTLPCAEVLPFIPDVLFQSAYQPYIQHLRVNMQGKGVLHFKQVSALLRCWWSIAEENTGQGAFVFYNVYDMVNILALESMRQHCVIVADDRDAIEGLGSLLAEASVYDANRLIWQSL